MTFSSVRRRHLVLAGLSTGALVVLAASPQLLGDRVGDALDGIGDASPAWLWGAACLFVLMHTLGGLAWSAALRACGTPTDHVDAVARYGIGSGLNAVAPAHLGSGVRIALFARIVDTPGAAWQVGGAAAAVGAVRATWLGGLIAIAAATGAVPAWPLAVVAGVLALAAAAAIASRRISVRTRFAHVFDAFRGLSAAPRALARIAALTAGAVVIKVSAATAIVTAFGIDHPLRVALVVIPAVELAAVMPITPGNAGLASAAIAMALGAHGVPAETALAIGIAFGAIETLAAAAIGSAGALVLAGPLVRPAVRLALVGTAWATIACAFSATVLVPLL